MYKRWKNNNGVTIVSLIILVVILLIVSTTIILNVDDRYKSQQLDKLANDLQLLTEKISIYYAENRSYPILNGAEAESITIGEDTVSIYKIDLEKLQGLTLNYGEGYKTTGDDYYGIDISTGTVYYKKGIDGVYSLAQTGKTEEVDIVKITTQPQWKSTIEGESVTFSVEVNKTEGITYQWYESDTYEGEGTEISGATTNTFTITSANSSNEKYYYCKISYDRDADNVVDIDRKSNVVKLSLRNYINYKIYGNTVDGVSVGEWDEAESKYKIPVTVTGKNLLKPTRVSAEGFSIYDRNGSTSNGYGTVIDTTDLSNNKVVVTQTPNSDYGANTFYNGYICIKHEGLVVGKTYRISFDIEITNNPFNVSSITLYPGGNYNGEDQIRFTQNKQRVGATFTEMVRTDGAWLPYMEIKCMGMSFTASNFMITEVDADTEFEPYVEPITTNIYLDEPLRSLEDVADYIDFENQKIVRYVKEEDGVLSVLEEPEITTIELPELLTISGKTNITVDTTVKPSKIEVN